MGKGKKAAKLKSPAKIDRGKSPAKGLRSHCHRNPEERLGMRERMGRGGEGSR